MEDAQPATLAAPDPALQRLTSIALPTQPPAASCAEANTDLA
jgi:hypothetical protein